MTDRLQQKAAEIVREQLGYQVPASLESMRVDHPYEYKCALAGLTAGIAMAAEREKYLVEKIAAWADLLVDVRGERDKVLVLAEIMNSFVKASQGPAVAKGETQHG